ncbi:hypothetical protein SVIO_015250 [Streptomyces violaceusniger]|uniref:Uncharacterized protein n=1 Tax=Streptomyces violaceusniger TaxID=68280 RepID=A0A4D4KQJ1_STRVO|nr:hypothetical protein SVIO_015250 [Streptomyces violaceusniger]
MARLGEPAHAAAYGAGWARYGEHLARTESGPRLQMVEGDGDVRLYGVPRRGELAALERRLRRAGIALTGASWRP